MKLKGSYKKSRAVRAPPPKTGVNQRVGPQGSERVGTNDGERRKKKTTARVTSGERKREKQQLGGIR